MADFLTEKQVADLLTVTPTAVRYWRRMGEGPRWYRFGRAVRYTHSDVTEWANKQVNTSPS